MKQGLDANISSMSQAEKTMLRYQYVMAQTGASHGDFSRTFGTWANQVRILKENFTQLGKVVGGTLINALKPLVTALNFVMGKLIAFAEVVSQSLGAIFGWEFQSSGSGGVANDFDDLAGSADDLASGTGSASDNLGSAANNAKKLKDYMLGIDELNVIAPDDSSSGGGSGGSGGGASGGLGGGSATGSGGQWTKTDSIFEKYKSDLDTLYKLGDYIGTKLTEAMKGIDWDKVFEGARNFGTGLADFLNGLISPELFGATGTTIANALNAVIYAVLSTGQTFDFVELGISIGTGINNAIDTFDFESLANTIDTWAQGLWNTFWTAIHEVEWLDIYDSITDFLSEIDLSTVGIVISSLTITKILKCAFGQGVLTFIANSISSLVTNIPVAINSIKILSFGGLVEGTGILANFANTIALVAGGAGTLNEALTLTFGTVATVVSGIVTTVGGALLAITNFVSMMTDGFSWLKEILMVVGVGLTAVGAVILGAPALITGVIAAIVAAVGTIVVVVKENWDSIKQFFSDLWSGIVSVWNNVTTWFSNNVINPITTFFSNLWKNVSKFFSNLWNDISNIWSNVSGWFSENVIEPVVGFFEGLYTRVSQFFEGLWIIVQAIWKIVANWFRDNVTEPLIEFFNDVKEKVSSFFTTLWENIKNVWNSVATWFNTYVTTPVTSFFKDVWTKVKSFFSNLWSDVKGVWNSVATWFSNTVITPVKNAFETATNSIGTFFTNLWSGIKKGVVGAMNAVIGGIESGINFIVGGINRIIRGFNKIVSWAAKVAEVDWGGVDEVPTVSLSRISLYEDGGFPKRADLFWANENGVPELVGTMGGKTAVASGREITGISDAVYATGEREASLLADAVMYLREIASKEMSVRIGDKDIARSNNRGQRSMGMRLITEI